jgi:hypothetical protein
MASVPHLGDQLTHGGQDIARTACLQRSRVARLVELSLRSAVVTHLRPFLDSVNRSQGAIPESGQTILSIGRPYTSSIHKNPNSGRSIYQGL